MRSHGRNNKRSRGNRLQDDEHYLGVQADDMRSETYVRPQEPTRHPESYGAPLNPSRSVYDADREPVVPRRQRHPETWRREELDEERHGYVDNGYHRHSGLDDYDVVDSRDVDNWPKRYTASRNNWSQRYDYAYPQSPYAESSSHNSAVHAHEGRAPAPEHWGDDARIEGQHHILTSDKGHYDRAPSPSWRHEHRQDKGGQKFQSDSGWDMYRRNKAWDETRWGDFSHEQEHRIPAERSWEPAPGWQSRGQGNREQEHHNGQRGSTSNRSSYHQHSNVRGNKRPAYHNKAKRDWRNDDGTLNNWQKREIQPTQERPTKGYHPRKKHRRSPSLPRSQSPIGSYYSRKSSLDRSRSRSHSPVSKRQRRGGVPLIPSRSPSERGRASWSNPVQYGDRDCSPSSPKSARESPGYRSYNNRGRNKFPSRSHPERDVSPPSPVSPASIAGGIEGSPRRSISRYIKQTSVSPRRSPESSLRRGRSVSSVSTASSERSTSRSPPNRARAVHRLPTINASLPLSHAALLRAPDATSRKHVNQKNGRGQTNGNFRDNERRKSNATGRSSYVDSMPPPNIVPRGIHTPFFPRDTRHHPSPHEHMAIQSSASLSEQEHNAGQPVSNSHFPIKNAGFRPISSTSSSLRKFFPDDDEDIEDSRVRSSFTRAEGDALGKDVHQSTRAVPVHHERKTWPSPPTNFSPQRTHQDITGSEKEVSLPSPTKDNSYHSLAEAPLQQNLTPQEVKSPSIEAALDVANTMLPPSPSSDSRAELYNIISQVGEGTFGKVYKAQNTLSKVHVALKRIRMESEKDGFPVTAMREIKLLQSLQHPNIVRLYEMMVSHGSVYMVFEYMDHDLTGILSQTQFNFSESHLKSLCHQMLAGLAYLHHKGVIHRDIKGSNILVNNRGELKLADFGLARFYQKRRRIDYTNRVITLWYRPPELLFGATVYGPEVDMWSAGCIMLELFTKKPVFQGNDEIHQLEVVYKIIGTPTVDRWVGIMNLPWYELVKPRETIPNRFRELFQRWMSPAALDLAEELLAYNPSQRISAHQAMEAPYFTTEKPRASPPVGLATLEGEWHELETKRERAKKKKKSDNATTESHHM